MIFSASIIALIVVLLAIWWIPKWQIRNLRQESIKDRFAAENEARKTIIQIAGGLFFLLTLYFTWKSAELSRGSFELAREGQVTQRFADATKQLGSKELSVRLGAIYALERIARDSRTDYWATMEVLTAYVRENAPWKPSVGLPALQQQVLGSASTNDKNFSESYCSAAANHVPSGVSHISPPLDIQAVMIVLGRRTTAFEESWQGLNLANVDLRGADLGNGNFDKAIFKGANLQDTNFRKSSLIKADLDETILSGALFGEANLEAASFDGAFANEANFYQSRLPKAQFMNSCLKGAQFGESILQKSRFKGALLVDASLWDANLEGADFELANLKNAKLDGAILRGADLRGALNVLPQQISTSIKDNSTRLP